MSISRTPSVRPIPPYTTHHSHFMAGLKATMENPFPLLKNSGFPLLKDPGCPLPDDPEYRIFDFGLSDESLSLDNIRIEDCLIDHKNPFDEDVGEYLSHQTLVTYRDLVAQVGDPGQKFLKKVFEVFGVNRVEIRSRHVSNGICTQTLCASRSGATQKWFITNCEYRKGEISEVKPLILVYKQSLEK